MISDFEKAENALGLSSDSTGNSGSLDLPLAPATQNIIGGSTIPSVPQNLSLIPQKPSVTAVNGAMFLDVDALVKYMKENEIKLPFDWMKVIMYGGIGFVIGYVLSQAIKNKK